MDRWQSMIEGAVTYGIFGAVIAALLWVVSRARSPKRSQPYSLPGGFPRAPAQSPRNKEAQSGAKRQPALAKGSSPEVLSPHPQSSSALPREPLPRLPEGSDRPAPLKLGSPSTH